MSTLRPDDRHSRGRSKSPGGRDRDRSRSRSNVRAPEAPEPPSAVPRSAYAYPQTSGAQYGNSVTSLSYEVRSPTQSQSQSNYFPSSTLPPSNHYVPSAATAAMPYPTDDGGFTMGDYTDLPPHERPGYDPRLGYVPPPPPGPPPRDREDDDLAYGSDTSRTARQQPSRHSSYTSGYRYNPNDQRAPTAQYEYAKAPEKVSYTSRPSVAPQSAVSHNSLPYGQPPSQSLNYSNTPQGQFHEQLPRTYSHNAYDREAHVVDITPRREKLDRHDSASRAHRLSTVDTRQTGLAAPRSPGLGPRMDRLSVSGNRPDMHAISGGLPPPSPMLEAYHGTYQSLSPMPLALRPDDDLDLDELEPLSPAISRQSGILKGEDRLAKDMREKEKKRVKLYDPEEDAKAIASALSHHKVDPEPIFEVLPRLTHDQIMEMRKEYKKQVKVQGKGVNLSKHINMKLSGNFGKAVYVTALGRWESEGYWANFFYQSHGSRRELLIECLMGRTNAEIRNIKDDFKDKRYSDSLTKCMEKELKMDKFRTAVIMVLEERRQEEQDVYPPEYVHRDTDLLYRSVKAEKGGESAMLEIIVRRSDAHLREVLRTYERMYGENFARAALKKSNNLVGEVIAHILNGVINKPARDALLLQHAIRNIAEKNKEEELRYELLISRLVRIHWDKLHLARVKKEYWEKYRTTLEDAIEEATKGDFREFMCELCETK
ncbi:hypothetical protein M409DRAFT_68681 [Zasmidium cellare ATCC 36951]|uniref:Annexin n=1 Tax=Zasmidium cellare ATCC 36951 TaxID=1080233 RepID=A0A6A6CAV4_ZASCE|nr:uncharacterized protein M409DRAFT_68681 [Zasmidium cellare ATCC 36951]KAF2163042.1 hypothetical protein M409DRAFT_68681 [Zasmidium cellare ATCC 36951]